MQFGDKKERVNFLSTIVVDRLKGLVEIATKYAAPWYRKLGIEPCRLAAILETWYKSY
jgi:hypothetical protein